MTRKLLFLFILTILTILPSYSVYSYCIYNKMEDGAQLHVHQVDGQMSLAQSFKRRFHHNICPNASECCPYDSRDSNKEKGDKSHIVRLTVAPLKDGKRELENTHELLCPAGGYIVVTGAYNSFSYKSYDAEHNIF